MDNGFTGRKKHTFANGNTYEGDFVNGNVHGKGKMSFANGGVYEGEYFYFKDDNVSLPHGKGKAIGANGIVDYEGDYFYGKRHGKGKKTWNDGRVYEGDWVEGEMHGKGKMTLPNGSIYEGDWAYFKEDKMSRPHGNGKAIEYDGTVNTVKDGTWVKGNFTG